MAANENPTPSVGPYEPMTGEQLKAKAEQQKLDAERKALEYLGFFRAISGRRDEVALPAAARKLGTAGA